jgi:glutaminase
MVPADRGEPMYEHVSTGRLPSPETIAALVAESYDSFKSNTDGANSGVYPALAKVASELFGVCLVGVSGNEYTAGDTAHEFSIMSVSKPFVFALVCQSLGPDDARSKLGANATGLAFDSVEALERSEDGRTNPMVNPGPSLPPV